MILDKLPEIEASYYTSNKRSYTGISDRIEDCSTALNTTQSVAAAQDREANGTAMDPTATCGQEYTKPPKGRASSLKKSKAT